MLPLYWAGLSTDLITEHVLMRSVKTLIGLTRGKGMSETQQLVWVLSMPVCANVSESIRRFSSISYEASEQHMDQHKDLSTARQIP